MRPGARLGAVIELIDSWHDGREDAERVLGGYFRDRRYIGSGDRREIAGRFYDLLRHHGRLSWWLKQSQMTPPDGRRRVLAALALGDGLRADAVAALFNGEKFHPAPLSAAEAAFVDGLAGQGYDHPGQPAAVKLEVPRWLLEPLRGVYGGDLARQMAGFNQPAALDLRVNTLKGDRAGAQAALNADGFDARPIDGLADGLRLVLGSHVAGGAAYRDGVVEVQDAASQICARLVDAQPGQRVLDLCAGGGGKTLALAAAMGNEGRILACDTHGGRLDNARRRARRAGARNIQFRLIADERDNWLSRKAGFFDRVLLDVPCSGTGTWRRDPAGRWRLSPGAIRDLSRRQAALLKAGARRVAFGGRLIYATCSILPEENEAVIEAFLRRNREFSLMAAETLWPDGPVTGMPIRLTPADHGTDGFFVAVLARAGRAANKDEARSA